MTGTISPEGKIGSIGGVLGKVVGSIKAGMKKIILPSKNQADFEKLPAKIKASITVHYAETFHDIYKIAFESKSFSECCITISRKNKAEEPQLPNLMLARQIDRRVQIEYSEDEESVGEIDMFHNFKPRYHIRLPTTRTTRFRWT